MAAASYLACITAARPARKVRILDQLPAALSVGAGLFNDHALCIHRSLRPFHFLPIYHSGAECSHSYIHRTHSVGVLMLQLIVRYI